MNPPYPIIWETQIWDDIHNIYDYVWKNASPSIADKVIDGIFEAVKLLENFPEGYPLEKSLLFRPEKFRFIKKWNYKIIYRFTGKEVRILTIFHSKRDPQKLVERFN